MTTPQRALARADRSLTRLDELFALFEDDLPDHHSVTAEHVPQPQRSLLDHERHMTVTLEKFHQCPVSLVVLDQILVEPYYARKILLIRGDGDPQAPRVVQFGIMRFDLRRVSSKVREQILAGEIPLGRILIENQVLRRISTHGLLLLHPTASIHEAITPPSKRLKPQERPTPLYGRLATILCNESPAVDLFEAVTTD